MSHHYIYQCPLCKFLWHYIMSFTPLSSSKTIQLRQLYSDHFWDSNIAYSLSNKVLAKYTTLDCAEYLQDQAIPFRSHISLPLCNKKSRKIHIHKSHIKIKNTKERSKGIEVSIVKRSVILGISNECSNHMS